ncbi:MAG: Homocitrate synthase, mitochondrial [Methanoculleus marisnigri]|uniref:Homocitrate synthase, mitochondrial n=1 Tax=Methanoculleus marisnigri TaxID=2198 RepID=A0A101INH1_9EURY|nr:MAG: Homocitrate synthase, mitochondrial [Methanoculleus marisnigri]
MFAGTIWSAENLGGDAALPLALLFDLLKHPPCLPIGEVEPVGLRDMLKRPLPRMLPEDEPPFAAHQLRGDILVGRGVSKDGGDVDPALVGKRVLADDRPGTLRDHARAPGDQPRDLLQAGEVVAVDAALHPQGDEHLLERRVPGTLADAVDGGVELERPGGRGRDGVGRRKPEVVVAVDAEREGGSIEDPGDNRMDLKRREAPDRIRKTDDISTAFDAPGIHLHQKRRVGPRGVLGSESHLQAVVGGELHHVEGGVKHLFTGLAVLVPDVEVRGGDEDADHIHVAVERRLDIGLERPCQAADPGVKAAVRDGGDTLLLCRRYHRKPGLDHLHTDLVERSGDRRLLITGERDAGSLLPVSQRYITDLDMPRFHGFHLQGKCLRSPPSGAPLAGGRGRG